MSPSSKTTRSKTAKKAPAKRKSSSARTTKGKTTKGKGSGRRPPSKRSPAKRKTSKRRSGTARPGLMAKLGAGVVGLSLLVLAALTFSWPDGASGPEQVAQSAPKVQQATKAVQAAETKTQAAAKADPVIKKAAQTEAKQAPAKAPPQVAVAPPKTTAEPKTPGEPAWQRFRATHTAKPGQPMIAIVLDDLGPNKQRSRNAIELTGPLTLAFLPYAKDLPAMTAEARERGHELLIHMPMEPKDLAGNNPGENALLTSLSDAEIQRRLDWAMQRFPAYVGLNNHMGSAFTADRRKMDLVMQRLAGKGALFLDSVTSGASKGAVAARAAGIPSAKRDIFLDHGGDDPGLVLQQLAKVEAVAKRQGYAVAIGHPHDGTVTALELWIPDALARGFALVPISALVEAPEVPGLRG